MALCYITLTFPLIFLPGDVIGCGIIYPSDYKKYVDLSTDDNSDGMTDVVLTSILDRKSMDFVQSVLNLNVQKEVCEDSKGASCDSQAKSEGTESDYYNENFVESRTQVEVSLEDNIL